MIKARNFTTILLRAAFPWTLFAFFAVLVLVSSALAQGEKEQLKLGEELLAKNCSRCHAIGRSGTSSHPEAPAFRTLSSRYDIEGLAEGLVEGFSSGHPDMPEFVFESHEAGAIIAYLKSIQER
jgi:cytochrome c